LQISAFDRTVFKQKTVIFGTKPIKVPGQKVKREHNARKHAYVSVGP
jgi:hypothetical protein